MIRLCNMYSSCSERHQCKAEQERPPKGPRLEGQEGTKIEGRGSLSAAII